MRLLKSRPNITELAYRRIKDDLFNGFFAQTSRLTEQSLSTRLGVSKSPIREALDRLATEGLVSIEPRRGASVRRFSPKEMADLYDLESVLEVHALGVAIITPKLLAQLRVSMSQTQRYLKDGDTKQLIEESHRFRRPIMAATGNLELCRAMESIEYRSFLGTITSYDLLATIAPETHTKVYKALRDGNRAHAQGAVRERLACLRVHLLNAVPTKGETAREGSKPIAGVSPPNSNNRKHPRQ